MNPEIEKQKLVILEKIYALVASGMDFNELLRFRGDEIVSIMLEIMVLSRKL